MADAIPDSQALKRPALAALGPIARPNPQVASVEIGLAVTFGMVFLFGVAAWIGELFGGEPGAGFARTLLFSQVATVCALIGFVLAWERMPVASIGISKPTRLDLEFGFALFILLLVLEVAVASLLPILDASEVGFLGRTLLLPLPKVFAMGVQLPGLGAAALIILISLGEELGARGYAYTRLERLTQSTVLGAGVALLIDLFAHAPLWGLNYTICIIPAQVILMWFYVSERRLIPCVIGHLLFDLLPLILLLLHVPLLASPAPAMNPHSERGMELAHEHEYAAAIAEFSKALRDDPNDAIAYRGRGDSYALHGDFDQAIKDLKVAIRLDPEQADAYVNRSFSYRSKGDLPHALTDIDSAIKLEPKNPNYLNRRGYIYSLMGDRDNAIVDFSAAIALLPSDPDAYQDRAEQYRLKGDYKKALTDADALVRLKPSEAYSYGIRADIEVEAHELDKALADARKMLALDPLNLQYAYSIVSIYKSTGRWDDEISFCKKLAADHPKEANAYACLADGYYRKGDLGSAIGAMNGAIGARPDAAMLYSQRATLEIAVGQTKEAQADVKKVAALQPNDVQANNYAAWILSTNSQAEVRDPQAAIAFAKRGCRLSSWKNAQLLDTLAAAYANDGDFSEAVKWQQYALKVAGTGRPKAVVEEMHKRLTLYQNHTPYREQLTDPGLTARSPD